LNRHHALDICFRRIFAENRFATSASRSSANAVLVALRRFSATAGRASRCRLAAKTDAKTGANRLSDR